MIVAVFYNEHNPPHIHVSHGDRRGRFLDWAAQIVIEDGSILEGYVPSRDLKLVRKWIKIHKAELEEACELARQHIKPRKIPPLKVR